MPRNVVLPRPFLKWAGGKTQLLDRFEPLYPRGPISRYVEPFVGSGAVFFHVARTLRPGSIVLADGNEELINAYEVIQRDVERLIRALAKHKRDHGEDHYYEVREQSPSALGTVARAARLIYLNKTCFNGLYRVNSRGEFNVPMGRYTDPPILDEPNLRAVARALSGVTLKVAHFRETVTYAKKGDFIYFDPPYDPVSATAYFTAYAVNGQRSHFSIADQEELASVGATLAARGCRVMLSNSDTPRIRKIYGSGSRWRTVPITARRNINSRADRRGSVRELVILGYDTQVMEQRPLSRARRSAATGRPA
ncbi:MAG: DNA adenine methylase [Acidobacteria bacterium]|nr:DNA adenine methylase [Acidobacteriota bacterium]